MSRQTNKPHKFTLDVSRLGHTPKKWKCPRCNEKRFVRFIDVETGIYLDSEYGRCDREEQCGYFLSPYAADKEPNQAQAFTPKPAALAEIKIVARDLVKVTLRLYDQNNLITYFNQALGSEHTQAILSRYFIGTAKGGATIFWQLDKSMRARTGIRILYNPETGRRFKDVDINRLGFTTGNGYQSCLFGEHLFYTLSDKLPVIIVESEKTAAICSAYLPTLAGRAVIWLASSGVNGLTADKIKVLVGKEIILCPDFSFHARATWGLLPMRKTPNVNGVPVPDANGELISNYVSYAQKLRAGGCKSVSFFDPCPEIKDSTDIADMLLAQGPPPPFILAPDFSALILPGGPTAENRPQSIRTGANFEDKAPEIHTAALGRLIGKSFRLEIEAGGRLRTISDSADNSTVINELINNNEILSRLITEGDLRNGAVMSIEEGNRIFDEADRRRAYQREEYAKRSNWADR